MVKICKWWYVCKTNTTWYSNIFIWIAGCNCGCFLSKLFPSTTPWHENVRARTVAWGEWSRPLVNSLLQGVPAREYGRLVRNRLFKIRAKSSFFVYANPNWTYLSGIRYAQHIADRLTSGMDVPSVAFEGQKVLVTFDSKGEKIGPINKGVYRAIKIRQIRERMEFNVLWYNDTKQNFWNSHLNG